MGMSEIVNYLGTNGSDRLVHAGSQDYFMQGFDERDIMIAGGLDSVRHKGEVDGGDGDDYVRMQNTLESVVYGGSGHDEILIISGTNQALKSIYLDGGTGSDSISWVTDSDAMTGFVYGGDGGD